MFEHVSSTYTYLLGCANTKEALIIDPVIEMVDRDVSIIQQLGLKLRYAGNTHAHADHVTGTSELRKLIPECRTFIGKKSGALADLLLTDGDELKFGNYSIKALCTPGHTNGCMTFVCHQERMAFTGDALLIRACGRTDFQEGDAAKLYDSVHSKIFSLPKDYILFPGHDYKGLLATSVEEEQKYNPRLTLPLQSFVQVMNNLNLSKPKQIEKAVPANMVDGDVTKMEENLRKQVEQTAKIH
ncbi:protein ETHE1, mitochondrial [Trichuris trichiura]|uniref:Persulfide dioxygenase ETHE1, mitochondrial n=1 Tax=Trichuris trichiura TaxID=36087 RepID=A0A077Z5Y3_TRITR|nr:protein ETHE1, mitochondrial [Trichuris trichiura]